jgi:SIR2-like domain
MIRQQDIVRRAAGLFPLADQLEQQLAHARKQVDKLTPSPPCPRLRRPSRPPKPRRRAGGEIVKSYTKGCCCSRHAARTRKPPKHNMKAKSSKSRAATMRDEAAKLRTEASAFETAANNLLVQDECRRASDRIAKRNGSVAVFLGAGASKCFGWPLTHELLPAILAGLIENDLFEDSRVNTRRENREDRLLLKKTLRALCPGIQFNQRFLKKSGGQLPLVTSLLSMLDFSLGTGQSLISGLAPKQVERARELMERAIYEIVEHELEETASDYWPMRKADKLAFAFSKWMDSLRRGTAQVGVVTSNYDLAIEQTWGFYRDTLPAIEKLGVDLGFPWLWASNGRERLVNRPASPKRRLYKLHGSTNWMKCSLCDRIHINPGVDVAIYAFQQGVDDNNRCHCGHAPLEAAIVSPSFVRDGHTSNLQGVWQSALDWLRQADDWIVIGYSFPDEDLNIRSLFARAFASRDEKPYVTAIQRENRQTQTRYEAFFPSDRLTYLTGGLDAFLKYAV